MVTIGDHAKRRVKKRVGIPSKSAERIVGIAWEKGLKYQDLSGRLKKYVDSKVINTKATPRVYGQFIYFFNRDGTLRTTYSLPANLQKLATDLAKKRDRKEPAT